MSEAGPAAVFDVSKRCQNAYFFGLLTRLEGPIFDPLVRTPRDIMSDTGKALLTY